ncbi:GDSL-type esterase/lipase family protein [Hoylesella timonensis]|uniref:GDSL-type esterase/lipase family protein n=1 Tax=Hoylesella timonensis TaxID=386414 RepID=UPI00041BA292|nr:GDSL-type esterase/lipase family protein [Hoylesella timonensis]
MRTQLFITMHLQNHQSKLLLACLLLFSCFVVLHTDAKPTVPPVRVACVGNSITYGTGIANRDKDSYPAQLQAMLGNKYLVGNFGKPGATLLRHGHRPYFKQQEFRDAMAFHADIAVIHLGINDTDPRNWPNYRDEFVTDYLALIDSLRQANPKVRIILARLSPIAHRHPRFISGTQQWHEQIQASIETVAAISGSELIDFHAPLYPYPFLLPDALHPNAEGAGIMAKVVYGSITGNYGGLHLPAIYTDNMVLQRDVPITIHGIANAGATVKVKLGSLYQATRANQLGNWQVTFAPQKAERSTTLTVSAGKQKRIFHDVAIGEVWLCSGQSNMAFMMHQAATAQRDIPLSDDEDLRLYDMKPNWETVDVEWNKLVLDSLNHLQYYRSSSWTVASPDAVRNFSAVAYYFGRMLRDSLQVPVGIICNAVGGSPTESWIDRHTLESRFPAILNNWLHNDFIQPWVRQRAAKNIAQAKGVGVRHPYEPCYLFESGILPLQRYTVKGVTWYQGESNAHNIEAHETLFKLLVDSWRQYWNNASMPFYFVQLSSLDRPSWTWFRDSQRRLMQQIPNTGMAVSSDLGDSLNVHPTHKQEIGERLARWALGDTYHRPLMPCGPLFKCAWREMGNKVAVSFSDADKLSTSDGKPVDGFEIAQYDGLFYPAHAEIKGKLVILQSDKVREPRFVRYGWQPYTRANLVNGDGLPASTFRGEVTTQPCRSRMK